MKCYVLALLLMLVFFGGCVSSPVATPSGLTFSDFDRDQRNRNYLFEKVSSKVVFRLEGKTERISGSGKLMAELPDRFYLEVRDLLGRAQLVLTLNGTQFLARYPQQKLVRGDSSGGTPFLSRIGFPVSFSELLSLMVGIVPWPLEAKSWEWRSGNYCLSGLERRNSITVCVDGWTKAVVSVVCEKLWELRIEDFVSVNGTAFGHETKIGGGGQSLSLVWDDFPETGGGFPARLFVVDTPAGYRREQN